MNSTVKFNEELMNLIEKVRLNMLNVTSDSLGAILTKLTSYNPSNIVFNNIDELAKEQNHDFKIYHKHLPHLNNLKEETFKVNNQFIDYNSNLFKNILYKNENTYTYVVSSKNLIKGRPKLSDLRVINGFEHNNIKVYYDNYMNFSIFIFDKVNKKTVNYYLQNNSIKFPIFCFYCSKARNLKYNCFDYNNFKKNLLDDINKYMETYIDELVKTPTDMIKFFVNYFDNYVKTHIPQTRSLDAYKNYLCCYKYNLETLKCLRSMFEVIDKCNNQLVNEEDLKSLKDTIETQSKLIKLNEEKTKILNSENDNITNESKFLTERLTKLSEDYDKICEENNSLFSDNDCLSEELQSIRNNKKCLSYINMFLILLLSMSLLFIINLEPDLDLYYKRFMLYCNYSFDFLRDLYNNTNMYDDYTYYDGYL
jgi:hypothetical protein